MFFRLIIFTLIQICLCQFFNRITIKLARNDGMIDLVLAEKIDASEEPTEVIIESQDVRRLKNGSFQGLHDLKYIKIANSALREIENGVFNKLAKLRVLKLNFNNLVYIKSGVFNNLPVTRIDLIGSAIEAIDSGAFSGDIYLEVLDLSRNKLKYLPEKLLDETVNLRQIYFAYNELMFIPTNFFTAAFWNVQEGETSTIDLSYNNLCYLSSSSLRGVTNIKNLLLNNNNLQQLGDFIFHDIEYLDNLNLESNNLSSLSSDILETLRGVNEMKLNGNTWSCQFAKKYVKWSEKYNKINDIERTIIEECNITRINE